MSERTSVVTRKGQVTIPAYIRRMLHIKEGDTVTFVLEKNGNLRLETGEKSVAQWTAGIFASNEPSLSAEELRQLGEELIAEAALERVDGE